MRQASESQSPLTQAVQTSWAKPAELVTSLLKVNVEHGLGDEEVRNRLALHGPNALTEKVGGSRLRLFLEQFASPVVLTLIGASILSASFGEMADTIAISSILLLNAIIGFVQQVRAENAVAALKKLSAPRARVIRNGSVHSIPSREICPGDILVLEAGDLVAADARLIRAHQLSCDEAALTGESLPVEKDTLPVAETSSLADRTNMIFAGTHVTAGSAIAVTTATGMKTEIGRVAGLIDSSKPDPTPLQVRLSLVGNRLLIFCAVVVVLMALLGLAQGRPWLEVMMSAISLAVAAIPEGLPAIVTIALALAVHRMAKRRAIVRFLPAVETLGSTDVICTDKTGTLTTGQMSVRELFLGKGIWEANDPKLREEPLFGDFLKACLLCSNADINDKGKPTGDPTEIALLWFGRAHHYGSREIRSSSPRIAEWAFDSGRKRMSVAIEEKDSGQIKIFTKGAPETVLPLCHIEKASKASINEAIKSLSSQGRRLLAVAMRSLAPSDGVSSRPDADIEQGLALLGFVAIADPPRPEAIEAIRQCHQAGIRVVMITGDHPLTAEAIAKELGILESGDEGSVLTGSELSQFSTEELKERVQKVAVYARVSPEDKVRIVRAWKDLGKIVAMTGDGVNDGPALKTASIGVSMGKGGTEVARQASSMILADDNFATIVSAVEEGRAVHGNIQRTIQYLLAGNVAEILIMLGGAILALPPPLLPLQLLWINLVTDGIPTLALAAEPVPPGILGSTVRSSPSSFSSWAFYRELLFPAIVTASLTMGFYWYGISQGDPRTARTLAFTFFVFSEVFRSFSSRSQSAIFFGLGLNPYHLLAATIPLAGQMLILFWKPLSDIFHVGRIETNHFAIIIVMALVPVTLIELRKLYYSTRR